MELKKVLEVKYIKKQNTKLPKKAGIYYIM